MNRPPIRTGSLEEAIRLTRIYSQGDVVAKRSILTNLLKESPYQDITTSFDVRLHQTLKELPARHQDGALYALSNIFYLTQHLARSLLTSIVKEIESCLAPKGLFDYKHIHLFACDHEHLLEQFAEVANWSGRLDSSEQRIFKTPSELIREVRTLCTAGAGDLDMVKSVFDKPIWIILTDNALGGGSLASDAQKLRTLLDMDTTRNHTLLVCSLITSEMAIEGPLKIFHGSHSFYYGLKFPHSSRVGHKTCNLFPSKEIDSMVKSFIEFHSTNHIEASLSTWKIQDEDWLMQQKTIKNIIKTHLNKNRNYSEGFQYGWEDGGFMVITHTNAPTNSLPILWHSDVHSGNSSNYRAPFPRRHSRKTHKTLEDSTKLIDIEKTGNFLNLICK